MGGQDRAGARKLRIPDGVALLYFWKRNCLRHGTLLS